ncbi:MAG: winged helix-turn-helix transcriptional regulator [Oligoflexia bacterium]|nr:winged helix-turn-helix transcriptional regulator [Oligoflexia bacterium]
MTQVKNKNHSYILSQKNDSNGDCNPDEELAMLAKALGHPVRVQILRVLARREGCICGEIVEQIENLAQSTVSQHLKILKEAGLIRGEVEGTAICYCIEADGLRKLRVLIAEI